MRVLVLSNLYPPDFVGGYELACAQTVEGLRGAGHEVRVLTASPRRPVPHDSKVLRRLKLIDEWCHHGMGVTPAALRLDEVESRFISAHNVHVLIDVVEELNPDVVYAHSLVGLGGLGLILALQYLGLPWVWHLGDRDPYHLCGTRDGAIPGLAEGFSSRVRGQFIAVSQRLIEELASYGIRLEGDVEVIPYWIDGERPRPRRSFYDRGTLRIMSAGQVSRQKGIDVLLEAAAILRDEGHNFLVDIYGHVQDPFVPAQVAGLGLDRHVNLRGRCPHHELLQIYDDYDLFAFPTHEREPFGLVALEAAARGCLPVVTRSCGIAEWLVHGAHCLKAERSPESFARAFRLVLERKVHVEPMAQRAADLAWKDFHLDRILPRIERKLIQAAEQPRARGGSVQEAYRLARLGEQIAKTLVSESAEPPEARSA